MSVKILIAEDEAAIREGLVALLESEGYFAYTAGDGEETLRLFRETSPDLVLLDVMMPKKNGYVVCSEIRASNPIVPILFLTAKDGDADELRGLTLGADDYISKTASQPVLLARIATVLKRAQRADDSTVGNFEIAGCMVDTASSQLTTPDGQNESLTDREVVILRYLASHPGEVLSRDALLTRFWGLDFDGSEAALTTAVYRLREKLGKAGARIESIYGCGYRLRCGD